MKNFSAFLVIGVLASLVVVSTSSDIIVQVCSKDDIQLVLSRVCTYYKRQHYYKSFGFINRLRKIHL